MTEAAQEATPKRRRKPKNQSLPVMKQLVDLMEQRTVLMNELRVYRMKAGQIEAQLQALAQEVEWRSSVLGLSETSATGGLAISRGLPPNLVPGGFPSGPFDPSALTQPIFAQPPQLTKTREGVNVGHADLRSLS